MKTVHINASKSYDILINGGILKEAGSRIKAVCPNASKCAIITDDIVDALYGSTAVQSLKAAGLDVVKFVFPNGEVSKNLNTLFDILNFLGENSLTRSDIIVALGGGVVGDTAGFAASVYLRGIRFVQIPTTLLAMVDSSVGGKTAVDLPSGKNLAGSFWQPELVLCDVNLLSTLNQSTFSDGCAEIIKAGAIADKKLFDFILNNNIQDELESVIERAVQIKADVVMADERDIGLRQILNFGHTIGHAIEKCSNYQIPHGSAVAIGMIIMSKGAAERGITDNDFSNELISALKKYKLPIKCDFSAEELYNVTLSDKKRSGHQTTVVVLDEIGKCRLVKLDSTDILSIIEEGI